jgi:hypothetical protein
MDVDRPLIASKFCNSDRQRKCSAAIKILSQSTEMEVTTLRDDNLEDRDICKKTCILSIPRPITRPSFNYYNPLRC